MNRIALWTLTLGIAAACVVAADESKPAVASPGSEQARLSKPASSLPGLSILRATARGNVEGDLARLTLLVRARSHSSGEQRAMLFAKPVAITDWSMDAPLFTGRACIERSDGCVEMVVSGKGDYSARLVLVVPVLKERLGWSVDLPVVNALATVTELSVPTRDVEFTVSPGVSMETERQGDRTTVRLFGGEDQFTLAWKVRAPEKALEPMAFAEQSVAARIDQGVLRLESVTDFNIVQGEMSGFDLRLPAGCSLLDVEGTDIRTWDVLPPQDDGTRMLKVVLMAVAGKNYRLRIRLEKVLPQLEAEFVLPTVEPLGVFREKGQIAVAAARGIRVEATALENIDHIDVRETGDLVRVFGKDEEVRLGFRYLKRPFALTLRTGEVVAKTSVESLSVARVGLETTRLTSTLDYTVRDAGVFQFKVSLDEGLRLTDVKGANINNWQFDETNRVVTVALRSKAEEGYRLVIEAEHEHPAGATVEIPAVRPLDVESATGYLALLSAPGVKAETARLDGIVQIDVKELPPTLLGLEPTLAFRHIRSAWRLALNVSEIEPEVNAELRTLAILDEHDLSLETEIHYDVRRAGVFQLRLAIPHDLRRTRVEGQDIDDTTWDDTRGILTVNLRQKVTGPYVLRIGTERTIQNIETGVEIPVIRADSVRKETGLVAVVTKASVRLKPAPEGTEGLDDLSVSDLPPEMLRRSDRIALAFKYYSQPWRLALAVERIEPRVTAEVFNLLAVGENLMTVSATVDYTIMHSGVDTFRLRLPPDATAVDIDGEGIKHREEKKGENVWTITLQSRRLDRYTLYANFQLKVASGQLVIPYGGVEALGVERETGYLAVASRPDVEIAVADADIEGLTPTDQRELPARYMEGISLPILLAYRYVSHPYIVRVSASPHEAAEVTVAVIESARLSTTLTEEGNMLTDLACLLRNSRQQYLDLSLPPDARILHAFVAGEPVTPLRDGDTTKIPVARANVSGGAFEVRLRFSQERPRLGRLGAVRLEAPTRGIDIMRLGWTVYLPEGYSLVRESGNLRRLVGSHAMEEHLRRLSPDVEVLPQQRESAVGEADRTAQAMSNRAAIESIEASRGKGQQFRSIYTGPRPVQPNSYVFQGLIMSGKAPVWVKMTFVKSSIGIPLHGVLAVAMLVVCRALWNWTGRGVRGIASVFLLAALLLAARTVAEGSFHAFLTTALVAACAAGVAIVLHSIFIAARDSWRRRTARRDLRGPAAEERPVTDNG